MDYSGFYQVFLTHLKEKLSPSLYYHSYDHTIDVLKCCEQILNYEIVIGEDAELVKTAALLHDAGFLNVVENHEEESAVIAKDWLQGFDYSDKQIDVVCQLILATRIPHEPVTFLEKIIRDADLDYLGRSDFFEIGESLRKEWTAMGKGVNDEQWKKIQIDFLKKHQYYTSFSIGFRKDKKEDNLRQLLSSYSMNS